MQAITTTNARPLTFETVHPKCTITLAVAELCPTLSLEPGAPWIVRVGHYHDTWIANWATCEDHAAATALQTTHAQAWCVSHRELWRTLLDELGDPERAAACIDRDWYTIGGGGSYIRRDEIIVGRVEDPNLNAALLCAAISFCPHLWWDVLSDIAEALRHGCTSEDPSVRREFRALTARVSVFIDDE